jgi:hypothetical protein
MASQNGRAPDRLTEQHTAQVAAEELRRRCDPAVFGFATTAELALPCGPVNQARAVAAMDFALGVRGRGYNVLVTGAPGTGRRTTVQALLAERAATRPAPPDWAYLVNFAEPGRPIAVALPSGRARELAGAMEAFVWSPHARRSRGRSRATAIESVAAPPSPTSRAGARKASRRSAATPHDGASRWSSPRQAR